ncbi:MAG: hypothetical protein OQJ95_04675 [Kangiella sp.]|nr:hypothetical protein [Kangiella sp.]MCW9027819.1 hypothetical protein [Kangiella sp.]
MHHKFIHILTIILALLAFIGQSNAMVDMPCMDSHEQPANQMASSIDDSQIENSQIDHSKMNHTDMAHSMEQTIVQPMDCCEDGGNCNMTTCSTLALVLEPQTNSQASQHNQSIDLYSDQAITSISSSLYRPPINC